MTGIFQQLFKGVMWLINYIFTLILTPIDTIITALVPSWSSVSNNISQFLNYFYNQFLFVLNWLNIPSSAITLLIAYITLKLTLYLSTRALKIFLKWYDILRG